MKPLRVLVIEDDAIIAMLLGETLVGFGHEVCAIATTENKAVADYAQYKPDLVILDAHLRDGSGMSALGKMLRGGFVPHLFITGDKSAVRANFPNAPVLEKPYFDSDLIAAIEVALNPPFEFGEPDDGAKTRGPQWRG
jgi:CheY-like chemotaxis protein